MKPWRCDPYLWVHLAGLATVPLWIDLCLLGLAVGNHHLPGLELGIIVGLGVLPVLVMQLRRPFYIFSLPGLVLRSTALQDDQRRLLTQFRRWRVRLGALLVPLPLVWGLMKLYPLAFLAREITPFGDLGQLGGLAIAALSFLMANLFLQVPVAVLQVLATPDRRMQSVLPYPVDKLAADFTRLGLPVGKLLPDIALSASDRPEPLAPQPATRLRDREGGPPTHIQHEARESGEPLLHHGAAEFPIKPLPKQRTEVGHTPETDAEIASASGEEAVTTAGKRDCHTGQAPGLNAMTPPDWAGESPPVGQVRSHSEVDPAIEVPGLNSDRTIFPPSRETVDAVTQDG